jgi:hypothetical protein
MDRDESDAVIAVCIGEQCAEVEHLAEKLLELATSGERGPSHLIVGYGGMTAAVAVLRSALKTLGHKTQE